MMSPDQNIIPISGSTVINKPVLESTEAAKNSTGKEISDEQELEQSRLKCDELGEGQLKSYITGIKSDTEVKQLKKMLEELIKREKESNERAQQFEAKAKEYKDRIEELTGVADEMKFKIIQLTKREQLLEKKMEEADNIAQKKIEEADRRTRQLQQKAEEADKRAQQLLRSVEEAERSTHEFNRKATESNKRVHELETALNESEKRTDKFRRRVHELVERVAESDRKIEEMKRDYDEQWTVRSEDINLTGPEIDRGGWATVSVAEFKGVKVAVKKIHDRIVSPHNKKMFRREMQMAARLRHPNLVQFIGATEQGDMMILMEYMPTSLRKQIEKDEYFPPTIVNYISLDIARALNYLHLMRPKPMIHRDISSTNVLLEPSPPPKLWKARVTDYGSVNLVHLLATENTGSPAYSAPEASIPSQQSPKMDIYSFGVLILEMITGQFPDSDDRPTLLIQVRHEKLLGLIRRCLTENPYDRPSACAIVSELSE